MYSHIADKWIAALRSGKFKQGEGKLTITKPAFAESTPIYFYGDLKANLNAAIPAPVRTAKQEDCCLGVLCKLAVADGVPVVVAQDEADYTTYDGERNGLPKSVQAWAGMNSPNGEIPGWKIDLAGMNDRGLSFIGIADVIDGARASL